MNQIHLILQGKGGVGKSMISSIIAQYLINKGAAISCVDLDPVNASFSAYKALDVKHINIMNKSEINPRAFDDLIELLSQSQTDFVIDSGASTFVSLANYLLTHDIPELLTSINYQINIHTVVTGGASLSDTVSGCYNLMSRFSSPTHFIVWLNPFWGEVIHENKTFKDMKTYTQHKDKIKAIIEIPDYQKETFGYDFQRLLSSKKTFDEAMDDTTNSLISRQRLIMIKRDLFSKLEPIACQIESVA